MEFETIWNQHKAHLKNFIKSKVTDETQVDDLLQDVSIKLYQSIINKAVIKNPQLWLFQVTRNTIADHYRTRNREKGVLAEGLDILLKQAHQESGNCICDLSGFVIQNYLPQEYALPLLLSDIEQIPQKKVAEILELSLPATKSRIQRARKKLHELIVDCIEIQYNNRGQVVDFQIRNSCDLPPELQQELEKFNFLL